MSDHEETTTPTLQRTQAPEEGTMGEHRHHARRTAHVAIEEENPEDETPKDAENLERLDAFGVRPRALENDCKPFEGFKKPRPIIIIRILSKAEDIEETREWVRLFCTNVYHGTDREIRCEVCDTYDVDILREANIEDEKSFFLIKMPYYYLYVDKDNTRKIAVTNVYNVDYLSRSGNRRLEGKFAVLECVTMLFVDIDEWKIPADDSVMFQEIMVIPKTSDMKDLFFEICREHNVDMSCSIMHSFMVLVNGILITYAPGQREFEDRGIEFRIEGGEEGFVEDSHYVVADPDLIFHYSDDNIENVFYMYFQYGIERSCQEYLHSNYNLDPRDDRIPLEILRELE